MPRPSRHQDRALLAAGRALLPEVGCAGLTIRRVCEAAGVNPGMFHYHFRTREAFLRAVMQEIYEAMYVRLTLEVARPREATAAEHLRAGVRVLGRFVRDHRQVIARVLADALAGQAVAQEFLRENIPRHIGLLQGLIREGQRRGEFRNLPGPQAVGFLAGSVAMPILAGGAMIESGALGRPAGRALARALLTDGAIDERIDLALSALAAPPRTRPARRSRP